MRRLEYIGGSSAKFWEGVVQGTDVVVSWGRIGTDGQTKRKEFATAEAARAFLDKQAGDKLKKGYTDTGSATTPAANEQATAQAPATPQDSAAPAAQANPAARPGSTGSAAPQSAAAPAGQQGPADQTDPATQATPAEPAAAAGSAAQATLAAVDEDTFDPPPGLVRMAFPRRDQGSPRYRPVADIGATVAQMLPRYQARIDSVLDLADTDQEIAEAARRHLAGTPEPLGAAAVVFMVSVHASYLDRDKLVRFPQQWLAEQGPVFAAEAAMRLATLTVGTRGRHGDHRLRHTDDGETLPWRWPGAEVLPEVRTAIAAADADEYAQVVAVIGPLRGDLTTRAVAAFLAPTEAACVEELASVEQIDRLTSWLYLSAANRADQLDAVVLPERALDHQSRTLPTILRTIGPAAAPFIAGCVARADNDLRKRLLTALVAIPTDDAFRALVTNADQAAYRAALQEAIPRYPVRATRLLADAAADGNQVAVELLRAHLLTRQELLTDVVPALPEAARAAALATQEGVIRLPDAPADLLPPVLASPPWTRKRTAVARIVIEDLAVPAPTRVVWADGERDQAAAGRSLITAGRHGRTGMDWAAELERYGKYDWAMPAILLHAPDELAAPALKTWRPTQAPNVDVWGPALLARFGTDGVDAVIRVVAPSTSQDDLKALLPVLDTEVATIMATALVKRRMARPVVKTWLLRHGLATLPYLLPMALAKAGKPRDAAEATLRMLATHEDTAAIVAEATRLAGEQAGEGVARIVAADPLELLPKKLPVPGAWAEPALLPQIRLRDTEFALPTASVADVLTMFTLGKPDEPYGGIAQVAEACDPASLAEFGWAVFEAWRKAGMPPKDGWALAALAAVGDDETVRRLAPIIRAWPGEGGHTRAVTGLDVLAEIGTDVALMHLNGIAQKVKFAGLKTRAKEKIELVAAKLGLTAEQLADRLVPDLGLADDGTLVLDYGPRKFVVGFDEALRPTVSDEDGTRRKALPKPGAKDDEELATAAFQRFSGLKKDVRTLAGDQILRLERAMVSGRRWSTEDFAAYFAGHPLLWHVVRRLVWGVYDQDGTLAGAFRLAEDRTLADADDETYTPPEGTTVGVAHPLHLGDALATWAEVFADYEILQPFPQLGRPIMALTDEERAALTLARFDKAVVSVGRVLGLTKRGWERTTPQDGGVEAGVVKPLPSGWFAVLELEEGIVAGEPTMLGENQEIRRVFLSPDHDGWWGQEDTPFSTLDAVSASELLADLTELVTAK